MSLSTLPLLPTRNIVVLPGITAPIEIGRPSSLALVDAISATNATLPAQLLLAPLLATESDTDTNSPPPAIESTTLADLAGTAVLAELTSSSAKAGKRSIVVKGLRRVKLVSLTNTTPYLQASYEVLTETPDVSDALTRGMAMALRDKARSLVEKLSGIPTDLRTLLDNHKIPPGELADRLSVYLEFPLEDRIQLLAETDVTTRLERVLRRLVEQSTKVEVEAELRSKVDDNMQKAQREMMLRQKKRALEEELAEAEAEAEGATPDKLEELSKRLAAAGLPEPVAKVAEKQLARLKNLNAESPEASIAMNYLDWIAALPWSVRSDEQLDVATARQILDEDHFGQDRIKRRLLEFIAVRKLAAQKERRVRAPLLCFVGPPGVGKTSLGRSVAKALGRKFVRMSLGGVRDEAEIRGHRRTYIGALPGRILTSLRRVGTKNPVVLLDEIDKLSSDMRGDPEAALLEVLDPEQNHDFTDHYLEQPFDLSEVLFIATANDLSRLSPPLRDRLEIITLPGYTRQEKRGIAREHLWPKQLAEHGLTDAQLTIRDEALDFVVGGYTMEAGVRRLEEKLAAIVRGVSVEFAEGRTATKEVGIAEAQALLGPAPIDEGDKAQPLLPGQTFGLAWSPVGGSLMNVEATLMPGKGSVQLTGQLGGVMKESVQASMSYIRSRLDTLGIGLDPLTSNDVHLHLPEGAVQKDGPSGGVAITAALVSLFTNRTPRPLTAATGEISLRGAVLPVGGIKEKLLAAHRAGIERVVLPERNRKDIVEVPTEVQQALELVFVTRIDQALAALLQPQTIAPTELLQPKAPTPELRAA